MATPSMDRQSSRRRRRATSRLAAPQARRGFTLVELLVVMAILGSLVAIVLPAVQSAREAARRQICSDHLKQLALSVAEYESAVQQFPAGRVGCDDTADVPVCPPGLPPERKTAASGFVTLLPYLEQQPLFAQLNVAQGGLWNRNIDDLGWFANPQKATGVMQRPPLFVCPSDDSEAISDVYAPVLAATGSYVFIQGTKGPGSPRHIAKYANDGMFLYVTQRRGNEVTDGLSHTLLLGEVVMAHTWESSNTWTYARLNADCLRTTEYAINTQPGLGSSYERQNGAMGSDHPGGALFAFADGHIELLEDQIGLGLYRAMSTIAGEE
jgi:prepilin-type N-terminal cleavage/methylation domain-containing protein/prepilin-type processing-associated H-X9-DG protein